MDVRASMVLTWFTSHNLCLFFHGCVIFVGIFFRFLLRFYFALLVVYCVSFLLLACLDSASPLGQEYHGSRMVRLGCHVSSLGSGLGSRVLLSRLLSFRFGKRFSTPMKPRLLPPLSSFSPSLSTYININ